MLKRKELEGGVLQTETGWREECYRETGRGDILVKRYLLTQQYFGALLGPVPALILLSVTIKLAQESRKLYQAVFGALQLHRSLRQVALLVLQCHAQEEPGTVQCESNTDVETDDMVFVV